MLDDSPAKLEMVVTLEEAAAEVEAWLEAAAPRELLEAPEDACAVEFAGLLENTDNVVEPTCVLDSGALEDVRELWVDSKALEESKA
jgi:hypothetical protein